MKYTLEIEINENIDKVVELFGNQENLFKWMDGLKSVDTYEGKPGEPGAKSKVVFDMGKKDMEMTEVLLAHDLPKIFKAQYEAKGVKNIVEHSFVKISDTKTKNITTTEFYFTGIMKSLVPLMKGMFKKQTQKYQTAFKNFVENQK